MQLGPITIQPFPLPSGNTGIVPPHMGGSPVPPWVRRDLGHEATEPTTNPTWHADFRK